MDELVLRAIIDDELDLRAAVQDHAAVQVPAHRRVLFIRRDDRDDDEIKLEILGNRLCRYRIFILRCRLPCSARH